MDLTDQIAINREYLHVRVRDSYYSILKIIHMPTDNQKEKTDLIAKHLARCLPANNDEKLIAATIGGLGSGPRIDAFNDYLEDVRGKYLNLVKGHGGATSQALDKPKGYHFEYKDGKVIVSYDPDRRHNSHRDNHRSDSESGSDEDDRRHHHRRENYHQPRGRGRGRGRGSARGRNDYHGNSNKRVVSSEQSAVSEQNKFDALTEYADKVKASDKESKQGKEELIKSGDQLTKAMTNVGGKKWSEVAGDEDSRSGTPEKQDKKDSAKKAE